MSQDQSMIPGKYVALSQVKDLIEKEQEIREELSYEQNLAHEHTVTFSRIPSDQVDELVEKIRETSEKVTEWHAHKLVDIGASHPDDVRAIFQKDRITPDPSEIDKIIEIIAGYL